MIKKILFLSLLLLSVVNAQMVLTVGGNSVAEYDADTTGSINIGVNIEEGNESSAFTLYVSISSGTLDATDCQFAAGYDLPVQGVANQDQTYVGSQVEFAGAMFGGSGPAGPLVLISGIDYTFESLTGDVVVSLIAKGGSTTIGGQAIVEDTVLDTLTIHHPSAEDAVELDLKYDETEGTIVYDGDLFEGNVITVTAVPNAGYRVKKWTGTDTKDPVSVQTVTLKKSKHKVAVKFEEVPEQKVTKATFKAGKVRGEDSFTIQGVLNAGAESIPAAGGSIDIIIRASGGAALFSQTLDYDDENMDVDWPKKITYKNKDAVDGQLEQFKYDIAKGKFTMKASDQDLTGWDAPLSLDVTIDSYSSLVLMNDSGTSDVINGKKYMPSVFMMGQEASLTVDKESVKEKNGTLTGKVSGRVTTAYDPDERTLLSATVLVGDYSQVLDVVKKNNKNVYTFKRSKDADASVDFVTSATFDFEKAEFKIAYKDATFDSEETLGVTFEWDGE